MSIGRGFVKKVGVLSTRFRALLREREREIQKKGCCFGIRPAGPAAAAALPQATMKCLSVKREIRSTRQFIMSFSSSSLQQSFFSPFSLSFSSLFSLFSE